MDRSTYYSTERLLRDAIRREPHNREYRSLLRALTMLVFSPDQFCQAQFCAGYKGFPARDYVMHQREEIARVVLRSVQDWQNITALIGLPPHPELSFAVYRGQICDYRTKVELSLKPALLRKKFSHLEISKAVADWRSALAPILGDLANGLAAPEYCSSSGVPKVQGRMPELLREPELGGTMQHYGFPTDFLDVTRDAQVALWFALHCAHQGPDGVLHYSRHHWSKESGMDNWPSIYVIFLPGWQMLDLTDGCIAEFASQRVVRQRAALASFLVYFDPTLNPISPLSFEPQIRKCHPALGLILKLHPAGDWDKLGMPSPGWYFPPEDPVQQSLHSIGAKFLSCYSDTIADLCSGQHLIKRR